MFVNFTCQRNPAERLAKYLENIVAVLDVAVDIFDEELLHPELPQYFPDVWQVFLQDFIDK